MKISKRYKDWGKKQYCLYLETTRLLLKMTSLRSYTIMKYFQQQSDKIKFIKVYIGNSLKIN